MRCFLFIAILIPGLLNCHAQNYTDNSNDSLLFKFNDTCFSVGQFYILHIDYAPSNDKWLNFYNNPQVDLFISFLKRNPGIRVELGAHTDCRASEEYNDSISSYRAKNFSEYLAFKKIPHQQVRPLGYGEKLNLVHCPCSICTEEEHSLNRRFEIKIEYIK